MGRCHRSRQVSYGMGAAGVGAVQSADGKTAWVFTAPGVGGRGVAALGAAPTAIPGVVFQGSGDGRLFAVSSTDGKQLWEFNTAQDIATANRVPARGGAIATAGAVIVDGMVYIGSGTRSAAARRPVTSCSRSAWSQEHAERGNGADGITIYTEERSNGDNPRRTFDTADRASRRGSGELVNPWATLSRRSD